MIDLVPEFIPPMIGHGHIGSHPPLLLVQQCRARPFEPVAVAVDERSSDRAIADRQVGGKPRAGGKPDQVERVGNDRSLVEIVDAPDQSPFRIAPSTEILKMQVADRKHWRSLCQVRADAFNALCPAEESSSKKYESALPHALVLLFQISLDDTAMFAQPAFVLLVVFDKRHGSAPWVRGDAALGTLSTACMGALWQVRNIR